MSVTLTFPSEIDELDILKLFLDGEFLDVNLFVMLEGASQPYHGDVKQSNIVFNPFRCF